MASKIKVNVDPLQDNIQAAWYNGAIPHALRRRVSWLLTHVLPRPTKFGDEPLDSRLIGQSNVDLVLWLLINYNELSSGHERILLRTPKEIVTSGVGYGIILPAACHPDSISVFQRNILLQFGWMGRLPVDSKQEPKPTLRIPANGQGGRFYQFGWIDELPQLLATERYRKPPIEAHRLNGLTYLRT
jgi:hypothetical protein